MLTLGTEEFSKILGENPDSLGDHARSIIDASNFRYRVIAGAELESLILKILKRIEADTQIVGAPDRINAWENGWKENLDAFTATTDFNGDALIPRFIRPSQPLRLFSNYIAAEDPWFELNFVRVLRAYLAEKYFKECSDIHEFGCGTGFNLIGIGEIFPDKSYHGSDFVNSSVELVTQLSQRVDIRLTGTLFDMKIPSHDYQMSSASGVLTFGSLEQLSGDIDPIFEFFVKKNARFYIHVEPAQELYHLSNLSDYLAHKFQSKRKYTSGLYGKLRNLETTGFIELLKVKRCFFGSLYMEGYNIFVWRPKLKI